MVRCKNEGLKTQKGLIVGAKYMLSVQSSCYTYIYALKSLQLHNIKKDVKTENVNSTQTTRFLFSTLRIL